LDVNKADFSFRLFAGFLSKARMRVHRWRAETAIMTPTKLLVGQILVVFAIVIVGVWFATEWCAAELGFQPQVGSPNSVNLHVFMRPDRLHPVKAGATRHRFAPYVLGRLSPARQRLPTQI
jgi:hypothetical protein